jgi:hypothetical protein
MAEGRGMATATLLHDGRVLVAGGDYNVSYEGQKIIGSAELFDPASGTFASAGTMSVPRLEHTSTLLPDGRVLIVGGYDGQHVLASSELFGPVPTP